MFFLKTLCYVKVYNLLQKNTNIEIFKNKYENKYDLLRLLFGDIGQYYILFFLILCEDEKEFDKFLDFMISFKIACLNNYKKISGNIKDINTLAITYEDEGGLAVLSTLNRRINNIALQFFHDHIYTKYQELFIYKFINGESIINPASYAYNNLILLFRLFKLIYNHPQKLYFINEFRIIIFTAKNHKQFFSHLNLLSQNLKNTYDTEKNSDEYKEIELLMKEFRYLFKDESIFKTNYITNNILYHLRSLKVDINQKTRQQIMKIKFAKLDRLYFYDSYLINLFNCQNLNDLIDILILPKQSFFINKFNHPLIIDLLKNFNITYMPDIIFSINLCNLYINNKNINFIILRDLLVKYFPNFQDKFINIDNLEVKISILVLCFKILIIFNYFYLNNLSLEEFEYIIKLINTQKK